MSTLALLPAGCGSSSEAPSSEPAPPPPNQAAASEFAGEVLGTEGIETFEAAGEQHGLDWTVLAAVSLIEDGPRDESGADGIAYALLAAGAPQNYEVALEARGGPSLAARTIELAGRLRRQPENDAPSVELPFTLPVEGTVVSRFGQAYGVLHDGIDIEAPTGTPIRAAAPGTVTVTGFDAAYGNRTCIVHRLEDSADGNRDVTTCYGNQSETSVVNGQIVEGGEVIGAVGCSGPCLRPHVHLQLKEGAEVSARSVDPAPLFGGTLDGRSGRPLDR